MEPTNEELLGSLVGGAMREGVPGIRKYLRKIFRKFSHQQRSLQINCQQGDKKECNNYLKTNQL